MHKLIAIVQARMSSERLPGKVLVKHNGKTLLEHQIEKLKKIPELEDIIVATSNHSTDDPIESLCKLNGYNYIRGDLNNVYARFCQALEKYPSQYFLRYCADRPFFDATLLRQAINILNSNNFEIITNVCPATFPKGLTIEIFSSRLFLASKEAIISQSDQEHVTSYFYRNETNYSLVNIPCPAGDLSSINLCIDTPSDFTKFQIVSEKAKEDASELGWEKVCQYYKDLCVE